MQAHIKNKLLGLHHLQEDKLFERHIGSGDDNLLNATLHGTQHMCGHKQKALKTQVAHFHQETSHIVKQQYKHTHAIKQQGDTLF